MNYLKLTAISALTASAALAQVYPPQGRLTLTSNTPVMTSDVVNTSTVYYTPYIGNEATYSTPNALHNHTFSETTLTLTSTINPAGHIYDVFLNNPEDNTPLIICTGPAWASLTSRGTGAGTTELTQFDGMWVNATLITACYNNGTNVVTSDSKGGLSSVPYIRPVTARPGCHSPPQPPAAARTTF